MYTIIAYSQNSRSSFEEYECDSDMNFICSNETEELTKFLVEYMVKNNFLNYNQNPYEFYILNDCEEINEKSVGFYKEATRLADEEVKIIKEERQQKKLLELEVRKQMKEEEELREYERLKSKYEGAK